MNQEELNNLIRLVKLVGGKFVIVEDGKPTFVVMSYSEFEDIASVRVLGDLTERARKLAATEDLVNKQITEAQLADITGEVIIGDQPVIEEKITIEPLDLSL